jgi:hypothetical protein
MIIMMMMTVSVNGLFRGYGDYTFFDIDSGSKQMLIHLYNIHVLCLI